MINHRALRVKGYYVLRINILLVLAVIAYGVMKVLVSTRNILDGFDLGGCTIGMI